MSSYEKFKSLVNTDRCYVVNTQQGCAHWKLMRKGRITMSALASFLIFAKTEEDKWKAARVICGLEKIEFTDLQKENMAIGNKYEDNVRKEYSKSVGMEVYEAGFCVFRENPIFGASSDGLFENGDLLEIKITNNDNPTTIYENYDEIPIYYYYQMQGNMFITDAKRCHYAAYSRKSGNIYSRVIPYNHERFINEVYIPSCIFHRDYIMPILLNKSLPTPYDTYKLILTEESKVK